MIGHTADVMQFTAEALVHMRASGSWPLPFRVSAVLSSSARRHPPLAICCVAWDSNPRERSATKGAPKEGVEGVSTASVNYWCLSGQWEGFPMAGYKAV
jgi:hypothetical protein